MRGVNEIFVKTSYSTGALYGTEKYTETVLEWRKMVEGEGLHMLQKRMKIMDFNQKKVLRFLEVEGADGIRTKEDLNSLETELLNNN